MCFCFVLFCLIGSERRALQMVSLVKLVKKPSRGHPKKAGRNIMGEGSGKVLRVTSKEVGGLPSIES